MKVSRIFDLNNQVGGNGVYEDVVGQTGFLEVIKRSALPTLSLRRSFNLQGNVQQTIQSLSLEF